MAAVVRVGVVNSVLSQGSDRRPFSTDPITFLVILSLPLFILVAPFACGASPEGVIAGLACLIIGISGIFAAKTMLEEILHSITGGKGPS